MQWWQRGAGALLVLAALVPAICRGQETAPAERKTPWTTSRIQGSPNPPLPYVTERIYKNVSLELPTEIVWLPQAEQWIATQFDGRVFSFSRDFDTSTLEPLLDLNDFHTEHTHRTFATAFHPDQENEPWCYVTYSSIPRSPVGSHLLRFRVTDPTVPTLDLSSREVLANWSSAGHAGGCMLFGSDGYFYLSIGDGQTPSPPDVLNTGQDLSDLQASILRIDVNNLPPGETYRIPPDNPFVDRPGARGEIWAFGLRNPWKMSFHPQTGDLYAGDVGWELREMVYRIERGGNYGWSINEGSQTIKPGLTPPVPITPPLVEHSHIEARSVTGGHVWQSDRLPELKGAYLYGDWMTGKVWGLRSEGNRVVWHQELVDTPLQIISFMLDPSGEVFIVGYDGTIHRLQTNPVTSANNAFPKRLSETGLFHDAARQEPAAGVIEYEISAAHWADGTQARQWIAVPGREQVGLFDRSQWEVGQVAGRFDFPHDSVLAKTVSYLADEDDPASERHLETQILHRSQDEWHAYNYVWNDDQTDALLQDDLATEQTLVIRDSSAPDGVRQQTWHHSSRSECLLCHYWSTGAAQGFVPSQLSFAAAGDAQTQLERLAAEGLFSQSIASTRPLVSPRDEDASLADRARSYLALNCATCHRPLGGGAANVNFELDAPADFVGALPVQGGFGLPDARIVAAGDPYRSVLLYRFVKSGRGHMPQFGSNRLDLEGMRLLCDWIASLSSSTDGRATLEARLERLNGSTNPDRQIVELLASTDGALALSVACAGTTLDPAVRERVVAAGAAQGDPVIRDLFEHFLPEEQRIQRLGTTIDEADLLAQQGSVERGEELFVRAQEMSCRNCHRVDSIGQAVGPDLTGIGTQRTPAELLASLLRPSERIDPKYVGTTVVTDEGLVLSGIAVDETDDALTLADPTGKRVVLPKDAIELRRPAEKSIMPELLLSAMTKEQAADLLAYLGAQTQIGPDQHKRAKIARVRTPITIDGKRDEQAWKDARPVGDFVFTWSNEGEGLQQPTDVRLLWDDKNLYVSFFCTDRDIQGTRTERDSDVYRDDCVEVFASPEFDHPENYFNLEMNVRGAQLDNYRPEGKNPDEPWNPDGIRLAVTLDGTLNDASDVDRGWTLEVAIPFRLFAHVLPDGHPRAGDQWRLNLNRLEDNMGVKSQWSRGDRNRPSFHVPEYFGFVEFVE